jgi:small-conductance mechanosensitive channel
MDAIESLLHLGGLTAQGAVALFWLNRYVLTVSVATQLGLTLAALVIARLAAAPLRRLMEELGRNRTWLAAGRLGGLWRGLRALVLPGLWLAGQWVAAAGLAQAGRPHQLVKTVVALLSAWMVIRLSTTFVLDRAWSRLIATTVWIVAALDILGFLDVTLRSLDEIGMDFGAIHLSLLLVIKTFFSLALLLWLAGGLSRALERRILSLPNLSPSAQVLFTKLVKVTLVTLGVVLALHSVGIDLTAFALVSGGIGLGIGFGLQKVVSNLMSGLTLLMDKSIKPGDVISLGDTYGWVSSLGARYVSVVTRDGIEHLIPNEELLTQRVQNWSFTNSRVRLKIPVGISYDSDLRQAMALCVEAALSAPRILADPPPNCLLMAFGASSLDLEIRCWISDPKDGVSSAKSGVLLAVWDRFKAAGISIPYPQTDVHIKAAAASSPLPPGPASDPAQQAPPQEIQG